jgi:hypothetical protein
MRSHPHIRRVAKWTGVLVSTLVIVGWVLTLSNEAILHIGSRVYTEVGGGNILVAIVKPSAGPRERKLFLHDIKQVGLPHVVIPLWIPLFTAAVPAGILFYRDRRRNPLGHCGQCGYNLTGNTSGLCPECGISIETDRSI